MDDSHADQRVRPTGPSIFRRGPEVPSWLLSLGFHVVVFLLLALTLRLAPRQGAMAERTADVGIVLKRQEGQTEYFESQGDTGQITSPSADTSSGDRLEDLFSDRPPVDPGDVLPAATGIIGPSAMVDAGPGHAGGVLDQSSGGRGSFGGEARPRLFGLSGEGFKFVYVFDRSASMGGSGRNPLSAAKAELIKSLESLDTNHQFQIIFYNEKPTAFNPSGRQRRLAFATEQAKERARRFIGSITADGATRHDDALKMAIQMQPDVIFFLTDADEPRLSDGQLRQINRWAGGITINAVEFGLGPKSGGVNFLERLARQNGGQYGYVDLTRLLPAGRRR